MRKIRLPKFKKETIYLFVAGIACVLLLVGTLLLLNSHLKSSAAMDVSKIDSSRSHIMVTGKGYYAKRGKKSEEEKKRKSRTRSDKSKAWKKAAPNPRNTKRSESRTGKIIKGDAGGKKGRGGRSPGKISPQDPSATPDDSAKTPADDANTETNKRKKGKNKGKNSRDKDNTATKDPNAPVLSVNFSNVDEKKTEEKKNGTIYINGTKLRFSLSATTHKGKEIERSEDWYVWLNGDKMYSRGGSKYKGLYTANTDSSGIPKLKSTVNNIVITVKDGDNKTTETYRISMDTSKSPKEIGTVTVSCDLDEIGIGIGEYTKDGKDGKPVKDEDKGEKVTPDDLNIFVPKTMKIDEGDTVSDVVEKYFYESGITPTMYRQPKPEEPEKNEVYLRKIDGYIIKRADKKVAEKPEKNYRKYRSERKTFKEYIDEKYLGEKNYGTGSGWKFKYNEGIPKRAMSDVEVNDGDKIILLYVLHP